MTFHYRYRKQIILITIIVVVLVATITTAIYFYEPKEEKTISSLTVKKKEKESSSTEQEKEKYMVDIKGEVNNPGIYQLQSDARVIDVINEAGGLTEQADTTVINLSKKITDEMVIIIYSQQEVANWLETKEQEQYLQEQCIAPREGQTQNDACIEEEPKEDTSSSSPTPSIININTASKEELMTLNGIGESKADAIIAYREEKPFESIEDIKNVSGIGDSIFEDIKDHITV